MFTDSQITRIAHHARSAQEGSGHGHTVYATGTPGRYVVGGYTKALLFPIGESTARIRAAVRALLGGVETGAETLGVWEDDGTVYVDLGTTWGTLSAALAVAHDLGELAIYDRETGECITVESRHARDARPIDRERGGA